MRAAEDILMEEMPVIPLYYYTSVKHQIQMLKMFTFHH